MKKVLCTVLALAMALTLLAGCGGAPASSGSTAASGSAGDAAGTTIKVAAIETAYGSEMWQQVAAAFEEETGIKVELTTDKNLEDVIGPGMKAGDYPDVIHLATGREDALTETFIKDNALADITDVLSMTVPGEEVTVADKLAGGFTETSQTNPYNDGKTYLAPMFYTPCGLFYNAGLFKEKGWELPTTWDEMWELGDKAKAEGISLFTYPTTGYFDAFFYALMYTVGGPEFFEKATHYEEGIWETEEAQQCFDIVAKLATYTEPTTPAQANDQDFTKNQQLVLDNKALFMPNGNWIIGEMAEAPRADGFEWGMMALPAVEDGGDRYSYTFFEQCWIPAGAENKELAKVFMTFLYSDEAADIFAEAGAVQPITGMTDKLSDDNKVYYSVYDNGAKAAIGTFATTTPVEGVNIKEDVCFTMDSVVNGTKTVDDWKAAVQKSCAALREALQ